VTLHFGSYVLALRPADDLAAAFWSTELDLLAAVSADLTSRKIPHALIGAVALAAHGIARASLDSDVLVVMAGPPPDETWQCVRREGAQVTMRVGDPDDPFRAVVRIAKAGSTPVDVLVGRFSWQRDVIARARPVSFSGCELPVVRAADLILLKLFAGGLQDLSDIERLLADPSRATLVAEVEAHIGVLPADCRTSWDQLKG
jgi:hypothetical protein